MAQPHEQIAVLRAIAYRITHPDGNHFVEWWRIQVRQRTTRFTIDVDTADLDFLIRSIGQEHAPPRVLTEHERGQLDVVAQLYRYISAGGAAGVEEAAPYLPNVAPEMQTRTITFTVRSEMYDEIAGRAIAAPEKRS